MLWHSFFFWWQFHIIAIDGFQHLVIICRSLKFVIFKLQFCIFLEILAWIAKCLYVFPDVRWTTNKIAFRILIEMILTFFNSSFSCKKGVRNNISYMRRRLNLVLSISYSFKNNWLIYLFLRKNSCSY